jgi:hypothetical protein
MAAHDMRLPAYDYALPCFSFLGHEVGSMMIGFGVGNNTRTLEGDLPLLM